MVYKDVSKMNKKPKLGATPDFVYEILKANILNGKYSPGERIKEESIAKELNVSRGSVRGAFVRLKDEGLLWGEPYGGVKVREISLKEAIDIINIRMLLEKYVVSQVILRSDATFLKTLESIVLSMEQAATEKDYELYSHLNTEFHEEIYKASGDAVVTDLLIHIKTKIMRTQYKVAFIPGRTQKSIAEHKMILDALKKKDLTAVTSAIENHLNSLLRTIVEFNGLLEIRSVKNE
ncbi:MAG: GntR family transcriptional regulator [Thermoplasmatales archaeon]